MPPPPPTSTLFPYTTLFRSLTGATLDQLLTYPMPAPLNAALGAQRDSALAARSEEHTSELQSHHDLVCRLLLEKKKQLQKPCPAASLEPDMAALHALTSLQT